MDAHLLRQQQQMNSGLLRYRSAPSSVFANFMDGDDDFITAAAVAATNNRPSSPEAESMFARFMGSCDSNSQSLHEIGEKSVAVKAEERSGNHFMGGIDGGEQIMYHSHSQPPLPPQAMLNHNGSNVGDNVYKVQNNMELDQQSSSPMKMATGGGNVSNLIRHSSSPAGLFANLHVENGYAVMRGMNFGAGSSPNGETTASGSRLKNQVNFPSGPPCSSGMMSPISESGGESMGPGTTNGGSLSSSNVNNQYASNFPMNSWDDSAMENFANAKRFRDSNAKMSSDLNSPESQNQDGMNQTRNLTHHFSLPKNSAEMAAILQFQDSVPCKIRAKRGCATHPRSIAERVRRTRISERMRKLQELVPNMDKQTNTADMLDLAVEYIKELQTEVKKLNDCRANCTCSSSQKPY